MFILLLLPVQINKSSARMKAVNLWANKSYNILAKEE